MSIFLAFFIFEVPFYPNLNSVYAQQDHDDFEIGEDEDLVGYDEEDFYDEEEYESEALERNQPTHKRKRVKSPSEEKEDVDSKRNSNNDEVIISHPELEKKQSIECVQNLIRCPVGETPVSEDHALCIGDDVSICRNSHGNVTCNKLGKQVVDGNEISCVNQKAPIILNSIKGDFNADNKDDVAIKIAGDPIWYLAKLNSKNSFELTPFLTWSVNGPWDNINKLDINGKSAIIGRVVKSSEWWLSIEKKDEFQNIKVGSWPKDNWAFVLTGDFDGDNAEEIAGITEDGKWIVSFLKEDSLRNVEAMRWGEFNPTKVIALDVDGNGSDDIVGFNSEGKILVSFSKDKEFTTEAFGNWNRINTFEKVEIFDLNKDGIDDLIGFNRMTGTWYGLVSDGKKFEEIVLGTWGDKYKWADVHVGYFNDNENLDFLTRLRIGDFGWLLVSEFDGENMKHKFYAGPLVDLDRDDSESITENVWNWHPGLGIENIFTGDFDGDGKYDLAGYVPYTKDLILLFVTDELRAGPIKLD